jgi:hypothetical protein
MYTHFPRALPSLRGLFWLVFAQSLALFSFPGNAALAGQIVTLFNTGVDSSGHVLTTQTDGAHGIGDPHYSLVSVPGGTTELEVYNYNLWTSAGPNSAWIAPHEFANGYLTNDAGPPGVYDYRTTFDLTGFDPSTALISGRWSVDNQGTDILVNGQSTGQQTTPENFDGGYSSFTIASGFLHAGVNTLDFVANNEPGTPDYPDNPTGLRVEFLVATASFAGPSVPEPSTLLMSSFACGLFGAAWLKRRLGRRELLEIKTRARGAQGSRRS